MTNPKSKFKTEAEKVKYIKEYSRGSTPTRVRKEIGEIWGVKKSARNEKFKKIFGELGGKVYILKNKNTLLVNEGVPSNKEIRGLDTENIYWNNEKAGKKAACFNQKGDVGIAEVKDVEGIRTLEDLIQYAGIDTEVWESTKFNANVWNNMWQVKAEFRRKIPEDTSKIIQETIESLKIYSPKIKPIHSKSVENNDLMLELVLADVHLGRLCWQGAGEDEYSLKLARDLVFEAVHDMAEKAKRFGNYSRVLLWIAGDFLNVDNEENTTTGNTPQSVDSRFPKVFKEGRNILVEVVNYLKEIAPVEVMITRGNHDFNSMYHLGEVIDAYFYNDDNVIVNNEPKPRKYYKFGQNLIQFCHGDKIDIKKLPSIMAAEAAKEWGETKWHECHTAHRHHEKLIIDEVANCKTRVMNVIAGVDGYHNMHGYVQNIRCAQSFIWSKEYGLQSLVYSKPID